MRLIDADALKKDWRMGEKCEECERNPRNCQYDDFSRMDICSMLDDAQTVDAVPVVHGRWVGYPECLQYINAYSDDHIICSACEECFSIIDNCAERFDYCPHCGAKMDGTKEDEHDHG